MTTRIGRPSVRAEGCRLLALTAIGLALVLLLAACGRTGGSSIDVFAGDSEAGIRYAQCVRDNGYSEFPDPGPDGRISLGAAAHGEGAHDRDDPRLQAAMQACSDLRPAGADHQDLGDPEYVEQMRQFAQCMRENGLPDFPDPGPDGRIVLGHGAGGYGDPKFNAAMQACSEYMGGGH